MDLGYESRHIRTNRYYGPTTYFSRNTGRPGIAGGTAQIEVADQYATTLTNHNTLEWKQTFANNHNVSVLVGEETVIRKGSTQTELGFGYKGT